MAPFQMFPNVGEGCLMTYPATEERWTVNQVDTFHLKFGELEFASWRGEVLLVGF